MSRRDQKERDIRYEVGRALDDFCNRVQSGVNAGEYSEEYVTNSLSGYPDFQDTWEEWLREAQ